MPGVTLSKSLYRSLVSQLGGALDDLTVRVIQALLGHSKLDATARYTRVATGLIAKVESPLDLLSTPKSEIKKRKKPT